MEHLLEQRAAMSPPHGEDVLLSEGRFISEGHETWEPGAKPFRAENVDPRTAIFRAREAHREKLLAKAALARQAGGAAATDERREDPYERAEASVVSGAEYLDQRNEVSVGGPIGVQSTPAASEEVAKSSTGALPVDPSPHAGIAPPSFTPVIEQVPDSTMLDVMAEGEIFHETVGSQSADTEVCAPDTSTPGSDRVHVDAADADAAGTDAAGTDAEVPTWFRRDLPHVCRACRDFRPAGEGQRGWCANRWAFTHRQLVQEDDIAPCYSSIGDWWAPVDDVWFVAADVSSHGRATPLLERLIAEKDARLRRS